MDLMEEDIEEVVALIIRNYDEVVRRQFESEEMNPELSDLC